MDAQATRRGFIAAAAVMAPAMALAAPLVSDPASESGSDPAILDAWARRTDAHLAMKHADDEERDRLEALIDASDRIIHSTTARTPRGVEVQLWAALHAGEAYLDQDEAAILRMDAGYLQQNHRNFDWNVLPLLAAIQSLRSMGDKA